jgi:F0F1-type ATP synthase membrane subunit b/b'
MTIFTNSHFWMIIAFIIMLLLFAKKIIHMFLVHIDTKIHNIENEVNNSIELHNNSISIFNEKKKLLKAVEQEEIDIINKTKIQSDIYYEKSVNQVNLQIKNLKKSFDSYLALSEEKYVSELNNNLVQESILKCENIIKNQSQKEKSIILDYSIDNILIKLNSYEQ